MAISMAGSAVPYESTIEQTFSDTSHGGLQSFYYFHSLSLFFISFFVRLFMGQRQRGMQQCNTARPRSETDTRFPKSFLLFSFAYLLFFRQSFLIRQDEAFSDFFHQWADTSSEVRQEYFPLSLFPFSPFSSALVYG